MKQVRFASGDGSDSELLEKDSEATINGDLPIQLKLLPLTDQIRELQTIIRDKWALTVSIVLNHAWPEVTSCNYSNIWMCSP